MDSRLNESSDSILTLVHSLFYVYLISFKLFLVLLIICMLVDVIMLVRLRNLR